MAERAYQQRGSANGENGKRHPAECLQQFYEDNLIKLSQGSDIGVMLCQIREDGSSCRDGPYENDVEASDAVLNRTKKQLRVLYKHTVGATRTDTKAKNKSKGVFSEMNIDHFMQAHLHQRAFTIIHLQ